MTKPTTPPTAAGLQLYRTDPYLTRKAQQHYGPGEAIVIEAPTHTWYLTRRSEPPVELGASFGEARQALGLLMRRPAAPLSYEGIKLEIVTSTTGTQVTATHLASGRQATVFGFPGREAREQLELQAIATVQEPG